MRSIDNGKIIQAGDQTGGGSGLPFIGTAERMEHPLPPVPHFFDWKQKYAARWKKVFCLDIAIDMTEDDQSKHRDTLIEKAFWNLEASNFVA